MEDKEKFAVRNSDRIIEADVFFQRPRLPVTAVLDNVRSAFNVGSIFRTADSACIEKLYLCGYTPSPPNEKLEKTALGAEGYVPWEYNADTLSLVKYLRRRGICVTAFETTTNSCNFFEYSYPMPLAIIFGNEKNGIGRDVLNEVDAILEVPAWGMKNSMNVANIFGIALYEVIRQYGKSGYIFTPPSGASGRDL